MPRKTKLKNPIDTIVKNIDSLKKQKKVHNEIIVKYAFLRNSMKFVLTGEKLWRENKLKETHTTFRQGLEYIQENQRVLDKLKDTVELAAVEVFKRDLKGLSEVVLFDREFQEIFLVKGFRELKSKIEFLCDFLKKNISKEFSQSRLQSIFVMKMMYLVRLEKALLFEDFHFQGGEKGLYKSLSIFKRLRFQKAEESLKRIDTFLLALKEKIREHGTLFSIPLHEESRLIAILQQGMTKEEGKAEYEVLRTGRNPKPMTKKEVDSLNVKDYGLYFDVCTNEMFKTRGRITKKIILDKKPKEILIFLIQNAGKMYDWLDLREKFFPAKKLRDGTERPYGPEPIQKQISVLASAIQGKRDFFIKKSKNVPLKEDRVAYYFDQKASYCLIEYIPQQT